MRLDESRIPVLVAAGQITERDRSGTGSVPLQLMAAACRNAEEDAATKGLLANVDHIAAIGLTVDAEQVKTPLSGAYKNVPKSVANRLGISPSRFSYSTTGGNTPQYLVNHFAEQIAMGHEQTVLLTGGETLATMLAKYNRWYKWLLPKGEWSDDPGGRPAFLGDDQAPCTAQEVNHGLNLPASVYPLFENALQHCYGRSISAHRQAIGELFSGFTKVAERNPHAWFQTARTASEITQECAANRMIAFPYTKYLNSMIVVNQAAAVVLTSVAKARSLGVPEHRWVFLHGCADAHDLWHLSERIDYHSSPAMQRCGQEALAMADRTINQIQHVDLYSCFPSAVQIACDAFGIAHDDPRGLSLTGGLPYFGGPGNSYSMHAIATMMQRLRSNPGDYGLHNAIGWFLTKHSLGVYTTEPLSKPWRRVQPSVYQPEILDKAGPKVVLQPSGQARVETFTVVFDREQQAKRGIIIGRLDGGERFVANTPRDVAMMNALCDGCAIGRSGTVESRGAKNIFRLR